jgi:hypothetical protein
MDDSTETPPAGTASAVAGEPRALQVRRASALEAALAGLQTGMLGVLALLMWLGMDASWDRRGFWSNENLFSSFFFGGDVIGSSFSAKTLPGLALYLIVYSLLGCIFAVMVRNRFRPGRTVMLAMIYSLAWFYLSFHLLWKSVMPLVYLLYADRPMLVGHLIYGVCLGAFPNLLPGAAASPSEPLQPEPAPEPIAIVETHQPAPRSETPPGGPADPAPPSTG